MADYLVSIVITTYRRPEQIVQAVQCALKQTCAHEIIVVDDNGRGNEFQKQTEEMLSGYMDKVTYLVNEVNSGPSFGRNRGLEAAKGKYITFLDDDDEIDPDKLKKQADLMEELGEAYSGCCCGYVKYLSETNMHTGGETVSGDVWPYILGRMYYPGSGSNLLCRSDVLRACGGYDESMRHFEDYEMMGRLLKGYRMAYVPERLLTIHYEVRERVPSYADLVSYDDLYFAKIAGALNTLPAGQKKKIMQTAALERWRYALPRKETADARQNMKKEQVSVLMFLRYGLYLADRVIRKKSYGFKPF